MRVQLKVSRQADNRPIGYRESELTLLHRSGCSAGSSQPWFIQSRASPPGRCRGSRGRDSDAFSPGRCRRDPDGGTPACCLQPKRLHLFTLNGIQKCHFEPCLRIYSFIKHFFIFFFLIPLTFNSEKFQPDGKGAR